MSVTKRKRLGHIKLASHSHLHRHVFCIAVPVQSQASARSYICALLLCMILIFDVLKIDDNTSIHKTCIATNYSTYHAILNFSCYMKQSISFQTMFLQHNVQQKFIEILFLIFF
jgi:hypothetical protein